MSEATIIPREMPKWACLSVIAFSATTIVAQCLIDIYQGTNNAPFLSPEWLLQAYTMSLPTFGAVVFALFCGWLFNIGHRPLAISIFVLATSFMIITTSNGWDFMANQTVAKTAAAQERAKVAREVAEIQNKQAAKERSEMTEELWRTYTTTGNLERKVQILNQIKDVTKAPMDLQTIPIEVQGTGSGGIFHRQWGWRPEAIQEAKALALPALLMVAKMLGLTLGFGFWPRSPSGGLNPPSEEKKPPKKQALPDLRPKTSQKAAYEDLKQMLKGGVEIPSQAMLARRWGVSEVTVHTWLGKWPEFHRNPTAGRRNRIVLAHANGDGRMLTQ